MRSREEMLRARLTAMFPPGSPVGDDVTSIGVRDTAGGVVVLVRLAHEDRLYGIPVSIRDTSHEFYYTDHPVADDEEWLDSVGVGMGVLFGTGFRCSAGRTLVDDYIELSPTTSWPHDRRFFLSASTPEDWSDHPVEALQAAALDTSPATSARAAQQLVAWVHSYENNSTGSPYVGQAVVVWDPDHPGRTVARLSHLESTEGVPVTVLIDVAHLAAHLAGAAGASTVVTTNLLPELHLVGFAPGDQHLAGQRAVDTSFLEADLDGAARLLEASLAVPSRWGSNRDEAGRHVPRGGFGSWWHRLIHPRTGRPPRRYVG